MKTTKLMLILAALAWGCGDDDGDPMDAGTDTTDNPDSTMPDGGDDDAGDDDAGEDDAGPTATNFVLRIENVSGNGPIPGPISPGVALAHSDSAPLFTVDAEDRGEGLVAIAEDGAAGELGGAITGAVVFNTPEGEDAAGPAFPGGAYEVEFSAEPGQALSFATMFVQSNDLFLAPGEEGIAIFDGDGNPLAEQDITDQVDLWDVGSEANEAPGHGLNQAPRQSGPDVGSAEGVVRTFDSTIHALPAPAALIGVDVTESGGQYTVTLTNTAPDSGTLLSPFSPGVYALHNDTIGLFAEGEEASADLELLAEDGDPSTWEATLGGLAAVAATGTFGSGPVMGGDSVSFDVTPTAEAPILSFATMVIATNDAFFALPPSGIRLLDDADAPRSAEDVQAEIRSRLAIWDAGTEIDQIPGAGPDQPQRGGGDIGADDPMDMVRRYSGAFNALADLSGFVDVTIVNGTASGDFDVTVSTTGVAEGFPILTPVAWAVHSSDTSLFEIGMPASAGLESLAEDGATDTLATALGADAEVLASGVEGAGPMMPGGSFTFTVTPDSDNPFFSFATMLVPSNDLFLAFGPEGVALLDGDGNPRSDEDIAADIAADLVAWDAGTEQNQSGAGGSDQAPRQSGPNTGEAEGNGLVRLIPDGVWAYPAVSEIVRVTVRPAE